MREPVTAIVLAGGFGRRMKSDIPKVLHHAAGRPLLAHVLGAAASLDLDETVVVVPRDHEEIAAGMSAEGFRDLTFAVQDEPRGTADAVRVGLGALRRIAGVVLVLPGDHPLLQADTLRRLLAIHSESGAAATVVSGRAADVAGRGRIVRDADGDLLRIVEHHDATDEERTIAEFNSGIYAFDAARLSPALDKVDAENSQGEYYLTDVIALLKAEDEVVLAHEIDSDDVLGVNSRAQLVQAGKLVRRRIVDRLLEEGVTVVDPDSTFIDATVEIGRDVVIHPFTFIEGSCRIGPRCEIGPNVRIVDSTLEGGATLSFAVVRGSHLGGGVEVGPFASVRPGTRLEAGSRLGTFVETKATRVGERSKIPHLSYIGDAEIGRDVNVGAGTITCNWDGRDKHRTTIEDEAYISSDTMLVAPVRIGRGAATGAGSVVRGEVPDGALAVGVPARIIEGKGNRIKKAADDGDHGDEG